MFSIDAFNIFEKLACASPGDCKDLGAVETDGADCGILFIATFTLTSPYNLFSYF
jgi:hypothetical protein